MLLLQQNLDNTISFTGKEGTTASSNRVLKKFWKVHSSMPGLLLVKMGVKSFLVVQASKWALSFHPSGAAPGTDIKLIRRRFEFDGHTSSKLKAIARGSDSEQLVKHHPSRVEVVTALVRMDELL
ncbi:hypothetical protein OIU74_029999 [Salix koriyanagi]|uniref:Uncharacterized protein n=1 Tax=Salix koriyanagi TaxID=2511006 RepID=A0A9Q0VFX7_9ROSI|nr:hypothetical protein OIU74_029999 [Salix koriyanagi]